jgi:hypothetical protein
MTNFIRFDISATLSFGGSTSPPLLTIQCARSSQRKVRFDG